MMLWNPICTVCRYAFEAPLRTGGKPTVCPSCVPEVRATKKAEKAATKKVVERKRRFQKTGIAVGQVFGCLTVVGHTYRKNRRLWNCTCSCGQVSAVRQSDLVTARVKSCGCDRPGSPANAAVAPGVRFGRWLVVSAVANIGSRKWMCLCECGVHREVVASALVSGHSQSCGCLARERSATVSTLYPLESGQRPCATCKTTLPNASFRKKTGTDRLVSYCRTCEQISDAQERSEVSRRYARRKLGLPGVDVPDALIDLKVEHIKMNRLLKERNK